MINEHNPIAQLITKIQQKWAQEITPFPAVKLIRLLINEDESQLYEGFLKLESSQHGKLPEIFVALLTPFHSKTTFSKDLIKDWFESFDKDKEIFNQLAGNGKEFNWNDKQYRQKALLETSDPDKLLLEILATFRSTLNMPNRKMTIALFHYSISSTLGFKDWIKNIVKLQIPERIQFCVFDLKSERYYDQLFHSLDPSFAKTLMIDLDVAGAVKKVVQSGDPNDPATRLQQYIQVMSEAVGEKNLTKLENTGNKCIEDMTRSKIKSLMATAHIVYAGLLFNFRKYDAIDALLDNGLKIAEAGKKGADVTCQALIGQFYSFKASNYQLNKKNNEAVEWFCRSAQASVEFGQVLPAITAYRHAASLAKKYATAKYLQILESGYNAGKGLSKEELSCSEYSSLGFDYYNFLSQNTNFEKREEIDGKMKQLFGENWKKNFQEKTTISNQKITA